MSKAHLRKPHPPVIKMRLIPRFTFYCNWFFYAFFATVNMW